MPDTPTLFMQRALDLAALGRRQVSPNPMVGCVIVHNGLVVGEGFHQRFGEAHAEVVAFAGVKNPEILSECEVYVSLEPCSHFGKTPPCADLIIKHRVKKVYVCHLDPNPKVAGRGIARIREAGIDVEVGCLAEQGMYLNRRFLKAVKTKIPYIIIKWAETADGFVADKNGRPVKITNAVADVLVHKWRAEEDAIMVGAGTVKADNPSLNARHWPASKNPIRVVIDRNLQLGKHFNVFDETQTTIVLNSLSEEQRGSIKYLKIGSHFLAEALQKLCLLGINSLFLEGGSTLISAFIHEGFYDEIRVLKSSFSIGEGVAAPNMPAGISCIARHTIEDNMLTIFRK
jgi:diaminohydroxyphosphoribosylaminopyrimidine deaminase / 5-amino-6-(5-phosphoribosylamino)uracil reductase